MNGTRRTYGTGTVTTLPSGRHRVQVRLPGRKRAGGVFDTPEEAERIRASLVVERNDAARRAELQEGAEEPGPLTLARWGEETWLKRRVTRVRWPAQDKSRWRLHVAPSQLARMPLADVRSKHVRAWLDELLTKKSGGKLLTARTVRHVFNLVRKAFADAHEDELVAANPAVGVKIPKRPGDVASAPRESLTAEEIRAVESCAAVPEASRLLYAVAIYSGLRQGELWGLHWGDVHEAGDRPRVVVRFSHANAPKNSKAEPVPLLPQACAAFARLRELATKKGKGPAAGDLVFPTPRGCRRQPSDDAGWSSRKVRGKARVGHREVAGVNRLVLFHGLRHTCGTHLLTGTFGVTLTLAEVAVILRHEDVDTTDQYAHLTAGHVFGRFAALHAPKGEGKPAGEIGTRGHQNMAHAPGANLTETPISKRRAVQESNLWPWASETHEQQGFPPGISGVVCQSCADSDPAAELREAALELLHAVDEGLPVAPPSRSLALAVLRSARADSPPWLQAVGVLEGGPLRTRRAVELAGCVLDAVGSVFSEPRAHEGVS